MIKNRFWCIFLHKTIEMIDVMKEDLYHFSSKNVVLQVLGKKIFIGSHGPFLSKNYVYMGYL